MSKSEIEAWFHYCVKDICIFFSPLASKILCPLQKYEKLNVVSLDFFLDFFWGKGQQKTFENEVVLFQNNLGMEH